MMQAVSLTNFPSSSPLLRAGRYYPVVSTLQIGYFVIAVGRLVFLPISLQGATYIIKGADPHSP